jgi:ribosomal protein S18 acetylase RimI-like enzyme
VAHVWRAEPAEAATVSGLLVEFRDWYGRADPPDEAFHSGVRRLIGEAHTDYLLGAPAEGEPAAGVAVVRYRHGVWRDGEDAWLEDLFVSERARGSGLGRALCDAVVARARERGCVRIELDVDEENVPARALYEAVGFGFKAHVMQMALEG